MLKVNPIARQGSSIGVMRGGFDAMGDMLVGDNGVTTRTELIGPISAKWFPPKDM